MRDHASIIRENARCACKARLRAIMRVFAFRCRAHRMTRRTRAIMRDQANATTHETPRQRPFRTNAAKMPRPCRANARERSGRASHGPRVDHPCRVWPTHLRSLYRGLSAATWTDHPSVSGWTNHGLANPNLRRQKDLHVSTEAFPVQL